MRSANLLDRQRVSLPTSGIESCQPPAPVLDGSEGPQAKKIGRFIEALREATGLTVTTWDERFTTVGAERALLEADMSRAKRKQTIDKVAAALILQGYLDSRSR